MNIIWLVIVDINYSSCFLVVISYHLISYVTISLEKIICWPLEVKNHINNTLATAKRWPRPLNRGGRWIEVSNIAVYWQMNRDFGEWPLNEEWPLNRWPLNRGRTVKLYETIFWPKIFLMYSANGFTYRYSVSGQNEQDVVGVRWVGKN